MVPTEMIERLVITGLHGQVCDAGFQMELTLRNFRVERPPVSWLDYLPVVIRTRKSNREDDMSQHPFIHAYDRALNELSHLDDSTDTYVWTFDHFTHDVQGLTTSERYLFVVPWFLFMVCERERYRRSLDRQHDA